MKLKSMFMLHDCRVIWSMYSCKYSDCLLYNTAAGIMWDTGEVLQMLNWIKSLYNPEFCNARPQNSKEDFQRAYSSGQKRRKSSF